MQETNFNLTETNLQQIADMLILNGTLTECPGLVQGKMGIAIFFFHYAQYTGNELFADYAMDLIGEMLSQIHVNSPADYEKGIAGIGLGIDYLIRNDYLNVEDDICEDFDQRMFRAVMYDPKPDFSQYNGLTGYGRYWITRFRYQTPALQAKECLLHIITLIRENLPNISFHEQTDIFCFLYDLRKISGFDSCTELLEQCHREWNLQSADVTQRFPRFGDSTIGKVIRMYQNQRYFNSDLQDEMDFTVNQISALDMEKAPVSMGLLNGYAGEGMLRLTALDQKHISWMQLL